MKLNLSKSIECLSFDVPKPFASGNWGSLSVIENKVYFSLCAHKINEHAELCIFDLDQLHIRSVESFPEVFKNEQNSVAHGKIHTQFCQMGREAYFGTHLGYYQKNLMGYAPYEGGKLLSINLDTDEICDLGTPVKGDGIISIEMDRQRSVIYVMTWPHAWLLEYNIHTRQWHSIGNYQLREIGDSVCRTLVCCNDGKLVFCQANGSVYFWDPETRLVNKFKENLIQVILTEAIASNWDISGLSQTPLTGIDQAVSHLMQNPSFLHMWHPALLDPKGDSVLGLVHFAGALVRISPANNKIDFIEQMSLKSERGRIPTSGASLSLCWDHDNRIIYHVGIKKFTDKGNGKVRVHLISYDNTSSEVVDWGELRTKDGKEVIYANTLGATSDGRLVCVAWAGLPEHKVDTFLATKPAKVDWGIEAKNNPYEMQLLLINQPIKTSGSVSD